MRIADDPGQQFISLYHFVLKKPDSDYFSRILGELNDEFNILWQDLEQYAHQQQPRPNLEEVKGEQAQPDEIEDLNFKDANDDKEDLSSSSKVLLDIYGPKIKQEVIWMFESPVVLVEKDSIGALGFTLPAQIPNVDYGGMRGDPYGDEYNDEKVDDMPNNSFR